MDRGSVTVYMKSKEVTGVFSTLSWRTFAAPFWLHGKGLVTAPVSEKEEILRRNAKSRHTYLLEMLWSAIIGLNKLLKHAHLPESLLAVVDHSYY